MRGNSFAVWIGYLGNEYKVEMCMSVANDLSL